MAEKKSTTSKKTTAKKAVKKTTKKAPAKAVKKTTTTAKKVAAKPVKAVKKTPVTPPKLKSTSLLPWAMALLFAGAFIGTLIQGHSWSQKFAGENLVVANGQTWMPVAGEPLDMIVLNDENCGQPCDPSGSLQVLRQNISPALVIDTVDVNSKRGQELVTQFGAKSVPQFIFHKGIAKIKAEDGTNFIDNLPDGFFNVQDDLYHLNNAQVGFKAGQFIEDPVFADLDTEPKKGTGPVTVVEFTDYQCPFCKRLHDNNKDLIAQLIADNKITYVLKDFPLNFHKEAVEYAHAVANCTLKEGGQEAYWSMNQTIFDDTDQWSGQGSVGKAFLIDKASELGLDIAACVDDPATRQEQDEDQAEGYLYGVSGTPALFIGGQVMPGAIGPDVFSAAVEAELKKK